MRGISAVALGLLIPHSLAWSVSILFLAEITQDGDRCDGDIVAVCRGLPENECCGSGVGDGQQFLADALEYAVYQDEGDDSCPSGREVIATTAFSGQAGNPCGVSLGAASSACKVQEDTIQGAQWFNDIAFRPRGIAARTMPSEKKCRKPDYYSWRVNGTRYEAGPEAFDLYRTRNLDGFLRIAGAEGTLSRRQTPADPPNDPPPNQCLFE